MHATEKKPQGKQPWVNGGFAHCYMFTASRHSLEPLTKHRVWNFVFKGN